MKLYKFYTDINKIPCHNWNEIQKSVKAGSPDLTWLIEKKVPYFNPSLEQMYDAYKEILFQMPEMDLDLNTKWMEAMLNYQEYKLNVEKNEHLILLKKKENKVELSKLNTTFYDYIDLIENTYENFQIDVFSLKDDFQELWKQIFKIPVPKKLIENKKLNFFIFDEYFDLLEDFDLTLRVVMSSEHFMKTFLNVKQMTFKTLKEIDKRLYNMFVQRDELHKWRSVRMSYFHINKLKAESKNQHTIFHEIIQLQDMANQAINLHEVKLGDLKYYREYIKEKIETQKPNEDAS